VRLRYEEDGCIKFLRTALAEIGIETAEDSREWRNWRRVDRPQALDVVVFQGLPFAKFHVALMLDARRAIQSAAATNGVARINIGRDPWATTIRGFYRRK
jgi:hypothetical protein